MGCEVEGWMIERLARLDDGFEAASPRMSSIEGSLFWLFGEGAAPPPPPLLKDADVLMGTGCCCWRGQSSSPMSAISRKVSSLFIV